MKWWGKEGISYKTNMEKLFVSCEYPFLYAMQTAIKFDGMKVEVLSREYLKDLFSWMAYSNCMLPI